jgi:hypothetical protein
MYFILRMNKDQHPSEQMKSTIYRIRNKTFFNFIVGLNHKTTSSFLPPLAVELLTGETEHAFDATRHCVTCVVP